jgi:hypothetical protein
VTPEGVQSSAFSALGETGRRVGEGRVGVASGLSQSCSFFRSAFDGRGKRIGVGRNVSAMGRIGVPQSCSVGDRSIRWGQVKFRAFASGARFDVGRSKGPGETCRRVGEGCVGVLQSCSRSSSSSSIASPHGSADRPRRRARSLYRNPLDRQRSTIKTEHEHDNEDVFGEAKPLTDTDN